jgi:hypothetical protein
LHSGAWARSLAGFAVVQRKPFLTTTISKPLFRGNHFLPQHHFQTVVQKETISYHNTISPIHGFPHNMVRLHKCYAPSTVALVHLSTFRLGHWQLYFCRNRLFVTPNLHHRRYLATISVAPTCAAPKFACAYLFERPLHPHPNSCTLQGSQPFE